MKYVSFSKSLAAVLLLICLGFAQLSFASQLSDNLAKLFAESDSLTLEQQIGLTEQTLYTDLPKAKKLLDFIAPQLATATKNHRHRIMLMHAHVALSGGNLKLAGDLLARIQSDKPDMPVLARLLYLRAKVAEVEGDFAKAINYLNKADQLPKEQLSDKSQFFLLSLAADLNRTAARYDVAISYTEQAIALARQFEDSDLICFAFVGIPAILAETKNYSALEVESYKAIEACEKSNNKAMLAGVYQDFSHVYFAKGNYKLQQQLLNRAIDLFSHNANEVNIPSAQLMLVNSYIADKQLKLAETLLDQLFELVEQRWGERERKLLNLAKSSLLEEQGVSEGALFYYKKYLALEQQQSQAGMLIQVAYYQAQFDSKINTQVTKMSQVEQQYLAGVSKVGSLQVWLLIVVALLFLSIPTYALTFYHRSKKITVIDSGKFDDLTSVYHFEQGLQKAQAMLDSEAHNFEFYGVAGVDIDLMKTINNSFDYDFGDKLIRAFAKEIERIFADCGIITRVRRNDFVIFFSVNNMSELTSLLKLVHLRLAKLRISGLNPNATCSIGYAIESVTPDTDVSGLCAILVGQAAVALGYSKLNGGNVSTKYDTRVATEYAREYQTHKYSDVFCDEIEPF